MERQEDCKPSRSLREHPHKIPQDSMASFIHAAISMSCPEFRCTAMCDLILAALWCLENDDLENNDLVNGDLELLFCLVYCIVRCVKVMEELKMNRSEIFNSKEEWDLLATLNKLTFSFLNVLLNYPNDYPLVIIIQGIMLRPN